MKVVDFFSGTNSWTKPWKGIAEKIFTIDNNPIFDCTICKDFMELEIEEIRNHLGGDPDVIYASFPCNTMSVASMGKHWGGGWRAYIPKSEQAVKALKMLDKMIEMILELNPKYLIIENPRAMMRKLPIMQQFERKTIWHCQYGKTDGILRAKPTDLFGRFPKGWKEKQCKNGNPECEHQRAPRGAKTGTQGLKNNVIRSMIPQELCEELMTAILTSED